MKGFGLKRRDDMRRNRIVVVMLVVVTVLAMATTALAEKPDKPGKPEPPDMWTCAERVRNGASWVLGEWVKEHSEDDDREARIPEPQ
jgi:hypothetical protein